MTPDETQKTPTFAHRLQAARLLAGLGQAELSIRAGLSRPAVISIEKDGFTSLPPTIEKLANVLRLSPSFLAFGTELPYAQSPTPRHKFMGVRLHQARWHHRISRDELSRRTGVSICAIGTTENDQQTLRLETVQILALALEVTPEWMVFGEGDPPPWPTPSPPPKRVFHRPRTPLGSFRSIAPARHPL